MRLGRDNIGFLKEIGKVIGVLYNLLLYILLIALIKLPLSIINFQNLLGHAQ